MISDLQLAIFANVLGVSLFLLVVLYHYVAVNNPKNKEKEWKPNLCEEWRRGGGDEGRRVDSSKDNIPYIPTRERKSNRKTRGKKQKMISFDKVPCETIRLVFSIEGSGSTNSPEAEINVRHIFKWLLKFVIQILVQLCRLRRTDRTKTRPKRQYSALSIVYVNPDAFYSFLIDRPF